MIEHFSSKKCCKLTYDIVNWVISYYIVECEQNGSDRAEYGSYFFEKFGNYKVYSQIGSK